MAKKQGCQLKDEKFEGCEGFEGLILHFWTKSEG